MGIEINGLCKRYRNIIALRSIDLSICPGIHGLIGSNGAGKTTLMRILSTILPADQGTITWGQTINWQEPKTVKGLIGYLPQQFGMYKNLYVFEAMKYVATLKNLSGNQKELIIRTLEQVNLKDQVKRKVGQLSGGMLRRLGLAQALLGDPKLLILDEPSIGLDPEERINLRKIIRDYSDGNRIVLISSHIISDIEDLCDDVSILCNGKLIMSGNTQQVRNVAFSRVKEEIMEEKTLRELEKSHSIIQFTPDGKRYRVRYLSEKTDDVNTVLPTLEDSYTYLVNQEQRR